jgi:PAS domain S-box-containing protein
METDLSFQNYEKYQSLIQSFTEYVVAVNRNYRIIMANDLFKNEFGVEPNELCYKAWKNRDKKCDNCLVEQSFRDGMGHWNIEQVVMKDGNISQMLIKSTPVTNGRNEIVYVLETATDITERQHFINSLDSLRGDFEKIVGKRLRDLQKSEEKYRTIFERSRDVIILTDMEGRIMEINQAGIEILGYETKETLLEMKSAVELFQNKEDRRRFLKAIFQDGYVTEFETSMVGKNGRIFDALVTSNVIVDAAGKVTGYAMIIRDITRRTQAQKQIENRNVTLSAINAISKAVSSSLELTEVLNSTIDQMSEILEPKSVRIYLLDEKKEYLKLAAHKGLSDEFISKTHTQVRKVGDGLLGQAVQDSKVWVVDNLMRYDTPYTESIVDEGLKSTIYVPLIAKGEVVGVMSVSSRTPFKFSDDYIDFLSAVGNQIGVAVHNANLYENTKRAYKDLKEAQEQVIRTEKLASLGKLAATIAHEINNPIAAVLNYIRLLIKLITRERFTAEKIEDISRYLSTMESETSRCGEIVKNLLAFSRQSKIKIEIYNIEDIIDRTLALIDHDLEMREIRTEKKIASNLPRIRCDFKQIQQALLNLMSNASEAMEKGGILTVEAKRSYTESFIEVWISDTGCGIYEEDKKNIFEPFFTTKEEGKGVGLGLSVVYGIITRHNGSIEVESEWGKGSTFKMLLPVA